MRKTIFSLVLFVFLSSAFILHAAVDVVLFEECFTRGTGGPVTVLRTFPGLSGPATIYLTNGDAADSAIERVSTSVISVNGVPVFSASNLNQNVNALTSTATLIDGINTISVDLRSKPDGTIRIQIVQQVEAKAAAVIGSSGGQIIVEDPGNTLYGTMIEIPENALNANTLITLDQTNLSSSLPEGITEAGPFINIGPEGTRFARPVLVSIPYDDEDNDGFIDYSGVPIDQVTIYTFDEDLKTWRQLNIVDSDVVRKTITFSTEHFSNYVSIILLACNDPVLIFAIDGCDLYKTLLGINPTMDKTGYLKQAILDMKIKADGLHELNRACVISYSGPKNSSTTERWDGNASNTAEIMADLKEGLEAYFNARGDKKFVMVTHSWGTILGMLALDYKINVNPDLLITLSSPAFTLNTGDGLYETPIYIFTYDIIGDTFAKLKQPPRQYADFRFPWGNVWAHGDLFSGPKDSAAGNTMEAGRVDHDLDTDRNPSSTATWHYITTLNRKATEYNELTQDERNRMDELVTLVKNKISGLVTPTDLPLAKFTYYPCSTDDSNCLVFRAQTDAAGASCRWDFAPDGTWGYGCNVAHNFPDKGGPYDVRLLVTVGGSPVAASTVPFCHPASYGAEGKVTTENYTVALPGATVVIAKGDPGVHEIIKTTVTDSNGNYRFTNIQAGAYLVYPVLAGYSPSVMYCPQLYGYMACSDAGMVSIADLDMIHDPGTIAMGPMAGPPGTTFTEWGTGFTPNSTATLHFRKPDGTEYPTRIVNLDSEGHFEITYTAPMNIPLGIYQWWAIDAKGVHSNVVSYMITPQAVPTIAMGPMAGPPGTTFTEWGTGFTPNSAATLHFLKPDGTEYPTRAVDIDSGGHFEITYTAPMDIPLGTYSWWAVDVSGSHSNQVNYVITP